MPIGPFHFPFAISVVEVGCGAPPLPPCGDSCTARFEATAVVAIAEGHGLRGRRQTGSGSKSGSQIWQWQLWG